MNLIAGTFNMNWWNDPANASYPDRAWNVRYPLIAETIRQSGAHIVCLQENRYVYGGVSQARMIAEHLGWKVADGGGNNAIIWNQKRVKQLKTVNAFPTNILIRLNDRWPNREDRSCVYGHFIDRVTGNDFVFAGIHGPTEDEVPDGHTLEEMRTEAGVRTAVLLETIREKFSSDRIIIGGDWNSTGGLQAAFVNRGYRDIREIEGVPFRIPVGWDTANGYDPYLTNRQHGWIIDMLLTKGPIDIIDAGIVVRLNAGGGLPLRTPLASDHVMVTVTVQLV